METKTLDKEAAVLGIAGRIGSGKSEAAKTIVRFEPQVTAIINIGDIIWHHCFAHVFGPIAEHNKFAVRKMQQEAGIYGREVNQDFWLRRVRMAAENAVDAGAVHVIVTGIRHPNEVEWIRSHKHSQVWCIESHNPSQATVSELHHPAEGTGVSPDYVIKNYGDEEFHEAVRHFWKMFKESK